MKSVANLDKNFAGIQKVRSAKGEAVIQQNAAVCHVDTLHIYGNSLAKILADGEIERGVRLEMIAGNIRIAIGESRSIVDIRREISAPRQRVLPPKMQRISLVVVEKEISGRRVRASTNESAHDAAAAERQLI